MYSLWGTHFFLLLLLPGLGSKLGYRERLRTWVSQQHRSRKWLWDVVLYLPLILMDQAATRDIYIPQVFNNAAACKCQVSAIVS